MDLLRKIFSNKDTIGLDNQEENPKPKSRKWVISGAIGGGIFLCIVIGYVMVKNIRAEIALFHTETPIPKEPNLKSDSTKKEGELERIKSAEEEIKRKNLANEKSSDVSIVSIEWGNAYEKQKALEKKELELPKPLIQTIEEKKSMSKKSETFEEKQVRVRARPRKAKQGKSWDDVPKNITPKFSIPQNETTKIVEANTESYFNTTRVESNKSSTSPANNFETKKATTQYIAGVVNGKQLITNGKRVSFRILEPTRILGFDVPKNTLVSGLAFLGSGRVTFQIASIRINNQTLPIQFKALDQDLVEGLAFEGDNPVRTDIRQGTTQAMQDVANDAVSYIPQYAGVAYAGRSLARGISRAIGSGTNRKKAQEIWLEDGYKIFFVLKN